MRRNQITSGRRRGMALVTVLLMLAVISALTVLILDRMVLSTRLARNGESLVAQRFTALAAEGLARLEISRLVELSQGKLTDIGNWNGQASVVPLDDGFMTVTVRDATACFNVNALVRAQPQSEEARRAWVQPVYEGNRTALDQFAALAAALGVDAGTASSLGQSLTDWLDSDGVPLSLGAEDARYARRDLAYRTAGGLMVDVSEVRAVDGMTPALFDRLAPWLCVQPEAALSPVNINLLKPEQAPLVAMLAGGAMDLSMAQQVILDRPANGYANVIDFWSHPAFARLVPPREVLDQPRLTSAYLAVGIAVESADSRVTQQALFGFQQGQLRLLTRSWAEAQEQAA